MSRDSTTGRATADTIRPFGRGSILDQSNKVTKSSGAGTSIQKSKRRMVTSEDPDKKRFEKSRCAMGCADEGENGRTIADRASAPGHVGDVDANAQRGCCGLCLCILVSNPAREENSCRVKSA